MADEWDEFPLAESPSAPAAKSEWDEFPLAQKASAPAARSEWDEFPLATAEKPKEAGLAQSMLNDFTEPYTDWWKGVSEHVKEFGDVQPPTTIGAAAQNVLRSGAAGGKLIGDVALGLPGAIISSILNPTAARGISALTGLPQKSTEGPYGTTKYGTEELLSTGLMGLRGAGGVKPLPRAVEPGMRPVDVTPHGAPGPEAAGGVSETPAAPPIGDEPKNTRMYGKDTQPTEPGAGVNVGEVDPTLAHALEQSTPEIDAAVRKATGTEPPPAETMDLPPVDVRPEGVAPIEPAPAPTPRAAIEQRPSDQTVGDTLKARTAAAEQPDEVLRGPRPGEGAAAPEMPQPTGGGEPAPVERQRKPREALIEDTTEGKKEAFKAAQQADDHLHQLSADPAGRQYRYYDIVKNAAKEHYELKTEAGREKLHDAIVSGKYDTVPDKIKQGYEQVKNKLQPEIDALRRELADRKIIEPVDNDPRYVHRLMKRPQEGFADPFSDVRGTLPGMRDPSSTKELAFRGAENSKGERIVLSGRGDDIAVMRDGKVVDYILNPNESGGLKTGDKVNYKNERYIVDRGLEREIEQHARHEPTKPGKEGAKVEYHKNPIASLVAEHNELTQLKAYHDWLDNFKRPDSPFKQFMTKDPEIAAKRGWTKVDGFKDLDGYYFHPDLQQALHNNFSPGLWGENKVTNAMRAVNQFAVRSMFWNPVPHSLNAQMHYLVGRGWDLIPARHPINFFKSHIEGFNAAINQTPLLQELNKAGTSLVMSKIDRQNLIPTIGKILGDDLKANPARWEQIASKFGIGKFNPVDITKAVYNGAQRVLWTYGDALMASRVLELEKNGMTRAQAIDHAAVHMPDYRLPLKFLGSRTAVRAMSDQTMSVFGRYHMGMINSLATMAKDTIGPSATMAQRWDALGNIVAMGVLGLVVKPMLDGLVQQVTGNKKAETRARGPLVPLQHAYDVYKGKTDTASLVGGIATMAPGLKAAGELYLNRNTFTGKKIYEPKSTGPEIAGQLGNYGLKTMVSPYATFGPTLQPGTGKGTPLEELGKQLFDVKVPTAKQTKGEQFGQKQLRKDATSRFRRPQGLLEYGVKQLERQFK